MPIISLKSGKDIAIEKYNAPELILRDELSGRYTTALLNAKYLQINESTFALEGNISELALTIEADPIFDEYFLVFHRIYETSESVLELSGDDSKLVGLIWIDVTSGLKPGEYDCEGEVVKAIKRMNSYMAEEYYSYTIWDEDAEEIAYNSVFFGKFWEDEDFIKSVCSNLSEEETTDFMKQLKKLADEN